MTEIEQLEQAIAALEAQRPLLGDAVIGPALASMREKLAALHAAHPPADAQRKLATVLFADLTGFTALSATLDPEEVSDIVNALWQRLDQAIIAHGGTVDKHIGDAVMALWGVDHAREDDPERAVRAALAMQAELAAFRDGGRRTKDQRPTSPSSLVLGPSSSLHLRIGLNTGPVLLGQVGSTHEFTAMGDAVNLASRLEHAAPLDGILISHEVYRHVRGVFDVQALDPLTVRGKAEPVQVYVVTGAKPRAFHRPTRGVEGVETPMVGREAEFKALQHALETVAEDRELQVVTVVGDAGVGKSRLLSEFEHWLDLGTREVWYFKGRVDAGMTSLPFALIRDLFAYRFGILESDALDVARQKLERGVTDFMAGDADAVEKAHFIGHLLGFDFSASPHVAPVLADPNQVRQRAFYYLTQFFRAVTQNPSPTPSPSKGGEPDRYSPPSLRGKGEGGLGLPAVILLEDIHWADDASLDLLDHLARELGPSESSLRRRPSLPLLIVALTRPTLFERRPLWGEGEAFHTRLTLRPLDRHDSRRLVDEILRKVEHVPAELRDTVVAGAEGNPFYLEELVKMLVEAGVISTRGEPWRVDLDRLNAVRVPPTLVGVLQARLDALTPAERETLKRALVVGQVFWDAVVAQLAGLAHGDLTSYVAPDTLSATLRALRQRELVYGREASQFAGTAEYTFKHAILRDVTYETVLLRERRVLHAQAAQWLLANSGDRADEYAALIAEHYERAGEATEAAAWYARAGRQAQTVYANQAAIALYEKALALLDDGGRQTADGDAQLAAKPSMPSAAVGGRPPVVELLLALGDVLKLVGRPGPAEERYRQALNLAEGSGDVYLRARCQEALGTLRHEQGEYREALEWLEQARADFMTHGDLARASQAMEMIGATLIYGKDYTAAQARLEESMALGRQVGATRTVAWALNDLGFVAIRGGDLGGARNLYTQSLAIKRQLGDDLDIAITLNNIGYVAAIEGHYAEAEALIQESLNILQRIGEVRSRGYSLSSLGAVAWLRQDFIRARTLYSEALTLSYQIGEKLSVVYSLGTLTGIAGEQGQVVRAARLAGATGRLFDTLGTNLDPLEQAAYERGVELARAALDPATFDRLWAEGQAMTLEEVVQYALEEE